MRYLMRVGPIEAGDSVAFGYLSCSESSFIDVAVQPNDRAGLDELLPRCKGEQVACEPGLASIAAERGLPVAELPEDLVMLKAAFAVLMSHGTLMSNDISPELLAELIFASACFLDAEAWNAFEADEPLEISVDRPRRSFEGCVMGQGGEEFGLALYAQKGSIEQLTALADLGRQSDAKMFEVLSLLMEDEPQFAVEAVAEAVGVEVSPGLLSLKRGEPRVIEKDDVAATIAALNAVVALAEGDGLEASGKCIEGRVTARVRRTKPVSPAAGAPAYEGVGRNDPCPCGSGKKFKKCHGEGV
jgi:hypothetical protein